jgi:Gas vesicle synthesis protein GvpL/GvpF
VDDLRKAIDADAADRVPELIEEARETAEARVRSILADAFTESLLERAKAELAGPPPPPRATGGETGLYVYGVVWAEAAELPANVELIEHDGLGAIVKPVPLDEYGEDQLHERLNDVRWLEQLARAHEAVLEQALSRMTVVPLRLCTIYRGPAQVEEMLDAERDVFADALHRLAGRAEWGVKLIAEPGALERAAAGEEAGDDDALSPGAAYMRGKSREAREREELDRIAGEWAEEVHDRLARRATEALVNPVQNPEVSGHVGDMLLNGVYLVPDDEVDDFRAEVEALAREFEAAGASVELTGPWPAYNFVKGSIEAAR